MNVRIEKSRPRSPVHLVWGFIALVILWTAWLYRGLAGNLPPCIFHYLTGLPCLTCGATRSIVSLSSMHFQSSIAFNPLVPLVFVCTIAFSLIHLTGRILNRSLLIELTAPERKLLRLSIIALVAINWLYLVLAGI